MLVFAKELYMPLLTGFSNSPMRQMAGISSLIRSARSDSGWKLCSLKKPTGYTNEMSCLFFVAICILVVIGLELTYELVTFRI